MKNSSPLVSVVMITYGHEQFIREAIEGVLMQETDFKVELIIADDNSPDDTESVVTKIINSHTNGHLIKYTKHKKNKGMTANFIWALEACKGNYIALCEGDDYWTDIKKLQKQVDFLERNPKYIMTGHNASVVNESGKVIDKYKLTRNFCRDASEIELKLGHWVLTLSMVFRNVLSKDFFKLFEKKGFECTDTFLTSYLGKFGEYHYMPEIGPAVYRIHQGGVWSMKSEKVKRNKSIKVFFSLAKFHRSERDEVANKLFRRVYETASTVKSTDFYKDLSLKEKSEYYYLSYTSYYHLYGLPKTIYRVITKTLISK